MTFYMDELLQVIGNALDAVEIELLGVSDNHGKRISVLVSAMGRHIGMSEDELSSLTGCALLHDNALTEYILSERPGKEQSINMRLHCEYGQRNVNYIPFKSNIDDFILYHHERPDGKGPFRKKAGEFPLGAALIAISDMLDAQLHLQRLPIEKLPALRNTIKNESGNQYTKEAADAMLAVLDEDMLISLRDVNIDKTAKDASTCWSVRVSDDSIVRLAGLTAHIIDYKSEFTRKHSMQIANKAWWMSRFYGFPQNRQSQVYFAASLHDIGKLKVPSAILEKPGKLNNEEFEIIKSHVYWTQQLLSTVSGLEIICDWASNHHEKLDGTGYPRGIGADKLDFISRLIACVDIYQAVTEERPYHSRRSHEEAMPILYSMAQRGYIDINIVNDLDMEMAKFPDGNVPGPFGIIP